MVNVRQIGDEIAELGECPVWSPQEQALYWADIEGRKIHRYTPADGTSQTKNLEGRPGSFTLTTEPGQLLVALETSLVVLDWVSGSTEPLVVVEAPERGNRLNDGRCDPAGRYVVGTMWPVPDDNRYTGGLYRVGPDAAVEQLEGDVGIPNSLVFDPDRGRMYWADTFHATIWKWDYDHETGQRSNREVFFHYRDNPDAKGLPDGACLDADGCVWSASVHGWALTRITPDGDIDRIVDLPVAMPTMPAFGGPDLTTIYVTSINGGRKDPARSNGVPAGALLAVEGTGVTGLPETPFPIRR